MTTPETSPALADAQASFEYYLKATAGFRRSTPLPDGNFFYPEETIQADAAAFAGIFLSVWRVLGAEGVLESHHATNPAAFDELRRIVTPNQPDPSDFTKYAAFWVRGVLSPPRTAADLRVVCRTLRNGLAHFNFRYIDVTPSEYFRRMDLSLPIHVRDSSAACCYRLFICDWKQGKDFSNPDSNPRIIETHFAHFRYHLFLFLARLFAHQCQVPYRDILTNDEVV